MSDPARGEVWAVDFGIAGKIRPALVVSAPLADADFALVAVVPHTTSDHPSQYAVSVRAAGLQAGRFNVQGVASLPLVKFRRKLATLEKGDPVTVERGMERWLFPDGLPGATT